MTATATFCLCVPDKEGCYPNEDVNGRCTKCNMPVALDDPPRSPKTSLTRKSTDYGPVAGHGYWCNITTQNGATCNCDWFEQEGREGRSPLAYEGRFPPVSSPYGGNVDVTREELAFIVSYLGHNDQDANHAWMVRRIRAVLAGKDPATVEPWSPFDGVSWLRHQPRGPETVKPCTNCNGRGYHENANWDRYPCLVCSPPTGTAKPVPQCRCVCYSCLKMLGQSHSPCTHQCLLRKRETVAVPVPACSHGKGGPLGPGGGCLFCERDASRTQTQRAARASRGGGQKVWREGSGFYACFDPCACCDEVKRLREMLDEGQGEAHEAGRRVVLELFCEALGWSFVPLVDALDEVKRLKKGEKP